ncbi:MAG: hypothetical protein ACFFD6_03180, partial [Candidatus Thorarchaeota archaeon]
MIDMRIHDINVEADLSRSDPNNPDPEEPVDYDGTSTGRSATSETSNIIDWLIQQATSLYSIGWILDNFWPKVAMKLLEPTGGLLLHIQIDLLGTLQVVSSPITEYLLAMLGPVEIVIDWFEAWSTAALFPEALGVFTIAMGAWTVADGLKLANPVGPWLAAAGIAATLSIIF